MHSFQPSRGRIFFEVLCALTVSASLVGAWMQTGASALLAAASAAALYALVHCFDMRWRGPAAAEEPQRVDFEPEVRSDLPAPREENVPLAAVEPQPVPEAVVEQVDLAEPTAARTGTGRRKGGSRKGDGRRAPAKKEAKVVRLEPPSEVEVADAEAEEFATSHIAPLFEPEPYLRMPRPAFGRKAGRFS